MMTDPQGAVDVAVDWLDAYYANVAPGWVSVFTQDRTTADRRTAWAHTTNLAQLAVAVEAFAENGCVWFGVATRKENLGPHRRGGKPSCQQIPSLWVDIDVQGEGHRSDNLPPTVADAHQLLSTFPVPPTATVNTGGGLQAHWLLSEPIDADNAEALLARWGATWAQNADTLGWDIDNVFNVDRVMRLPGTWNRKHTPTLVEIVEADWTRQYGVDDLEQWTIEPPTPPATDQTAARLPYIGPRRPGDAFNATRTGNDVLRAAGFVDPRQAGGDTHWCRPGKNQREGHSATVYADGHTTLWSDTIVTNWPHAQLRRPYDPFGLYTVLFHHGNFRAASDELERQGYGTKAVDRDNLEWAVIQEPATRQPVAAVEHANLPDTFWQARPHLDHIRQAARARRIAPDAVLGAVLTRVAAITPHPVELPAIVGAPVGLTYYAAIVGSAEAGKSSAANLAAELLPAPGHVLDRLPIGSGEGMVEILFDLVEEEDERGKKRKVKQQIRNAAIFHIDEGQILSDLANRQGTTLLPTLRTAFSHGTLGNANASIERKRIVDGRKYVYGITLGIQPELAGPLLSDTAAGTPQRFVWLTAHDHHTPDQRPADPGPLDWQPPDVGQLEQRAVIRGGYKRYQLDVAATIVTELDTDRVGVMRSAAHRSSSEAHQGLVRLKTAALLALLDNRLAVTDNDWQLAATIINTSRRVRSSVESTLRVVDAGKEQATLERQARRELYVEESRSEKALTQGAAQIGRAVRKHHEAGVHEGASGCPKRCCHGSLSPRIKSVISVDQAITEAVQRRFITEQDGRFHPGEARPA